MISMTDYLWFVDRALGQMAAIVEDLGDELASARPNLPGANSPFGILTHCLGVMGGWGGRFVAGRDIVRDRDAEFGATGPVAALLGRIPAARAALERDVSTADVSAPLRHPTSPADAELPFGPRAPRSCTSTRSFPNTSGRWS